VLPSNEATDRDIRIKSQSVGGSEKISRRAKPSDSTPVVSIDSRVPPTEGLQSSEKKPIEVKVNVQLFRLRKVDNSAEEVQLDMGLTFIWHDPHLRELFGGSVPLLSTHPSIARHRPNVSVMEPQLWPEHMQVGLGLFDPAWKIDGCSEMNIIKSVSSVHDRERSIVHSYVHIVATVHHSLDLKSFPFDATKLRIRMLSEHKTSSLVFVPFEDRAPKVYHELSTEWRILGPIVIEPEADGTKAASGKECYILEERRQFIPHLLFLQDTHMPRSFSASRSCAALSGMCIMFSSHPSWWFWRLSPCF
jgi:hypothetical protein